MSYGIPDPLEGFLRSIRATATLHREIQHATQYTVADDAETVTLNVFSTGKVVVQGKGDSALRERLQSFLRATPTGERREPRGNASGVVPAATPRVGTDEAGKGEYFGPLVVAGVRVLDAGQSRRLQGLGVRDSKTVANVRAARLAAAILGAVGAQNVRVATLPPPEYERRRRAAGSVQRLLGELHGGILGELQDGVEVAVVDSLGTGSGLERHAPPGLRVEMRPRAEDDVAVAAASVVARSRYLEEMDRLSLRVGFELPRGSTHVRGAILRVHSELGMEGLREVGKTHFSITEQVLDERGGCER